MINLVLVIKLSITSIFDCSVISIKNVFFKVFTEHNI